MIKKGCIARCKAGMLGLVTSDEPGKDGWVGIQLSPDKAGRKWTSTDPTIIARSIEDLLSATDTSVLMSLYDYLDETGDE